MFLSGSMAIPSWPDPLPKSQVFCGNWLAVLGNGIAIVVLLLKLLVNSDNKSVYLSQLGGAFWANVPNDATNNIDRITRFALATRRRKEDKENIFLWVKYICPKEYQQLYQLYTSRVSILKYLCFLSVYHNLIVK